MVEEFAGIENVIISATGYTGSGGFEIYCKNSEVEQVWNNVLEAGKEFGIKPIGLAARDTLRLKAQKAEGPQRKLIAFEIEDRGIPRQGYDIVDEAGNTIGIVTSGTMSPSLNKGIGLGYVPSNMSGFGEPIYIQIRKKAVKATIVKLPFYKG